MNNKELEDCRQNTLGPSLDKSTFKDLKIVKGYDLENGVDYGRMFESYGNMGIQATQIGKGFEIINKMINWELKLDTTAEKTEEDLADPEKCRCKIFLGFTTNCVSSGLRESIRYLCEHRMINVIVTPVTSIDEDLMKCFNPHYLSDFIAVDPVSDKSERNHKIGNISIPEENISAYKEWVLKEISKMHDEQDKNGVIWSPSKIITRLGEAINNKKSIFYWCAKNKIPVFSPAFTDGQFGDILYVYGKKRPGFIVDIADDIRLLNREPMVAKKTGVIILGGGLIKHHILNANLMRNGTDFAVFVNTGQEFDCSDAGAKPQEALSWGKLKLDCKFSKIYAEASLVFPILISQTFAKYKEKASKLLL